MNIEIGNTTQPFEQENEVIWNLKKKTRFKMIRLLFSQTLIRSRTSFECSDSLVSIKSSKFTSQICPNISWITSFIEEFSDFLEPIIFSHDPLFLTDDFDIRVDDRNDTAACHFFLIYWSRYH